MLSLFVKDGANVILFFVVQIKTDIFLIVSYQILIIHI